MFSPRGVARLGLGAACLISAVCVVILVAGAGVARPPSASDFALTDLHGGNVRLSALRGKIVLLYFTSIRCPASNDYSARLADLQRKYAGDDRVRILAVHCEAGSDALSPQDRREISLQTGLSGLDFPQLLDANGQTARSYGVHLLPTFFVIDTDGAISYRGSFDDSRRASRVQMHYVQDAVESLLHNKPIANPRTEAVGCERGQ
jgi:peroxiredoxin